MTSERGLGWMARGALLAAVLIIPACGGRAKGTQPGTTGAKWNSTQATTGGTNVTPLMWRDPNLGPISGSGGTGDLIYGIAFSLPLGDPDYNRPVNLGTAFSKTEEINIEAEVTAYRQAWVTANNGGGGGGGLGGGGFIGGFQQLPGLYYSDNLRAIARARCKDITQTNNAPASLAARMTAAMLSYTAPSEYYNMATVCATAKEAWVAMGGGNNASAVSTRARAGGWFGGGYWPAATGAPNPSQWGLVFCDSGSATGP